MENKNEIPAIVYEKKADARHNRLVLPKYFIDKYVYYE